MRSSTRAAGSPSSLPYLASLDHWSAWSAMEAVEGSPHPQKRARFLLSQEQAVGECPDQQVIVGNGSLLDALPDDLVLTILAALSSSALRALDLINAMLTCRRLKILVSHPLVLAKTSVAALRVRPERWCDSAHLFLSRCKEAGNAEAGYTLGMIRFYCLRDTTGGLEALISAATASLPAALHSLAIIQFNGSGGSREKKDLKAGVRLCARAAALHYVDAMRELGHCLQDGYGVPKNAPAGRRLILEANAREAAAALPQCKAALWIHCSHCQLVAKTAENGNIERAALHVSHYLCHHPVYRILQTGGCSFLSDFGCNVRPPPLHPAHEFMVEWFQLQPPAEGLRLCSYPMCGRPEIRKHEFRRCSACASVGYCSRACQALDWKLRHRHICAGAARPAAIRRQIVPILPHT